VPSIRAWRFCAARNEGMLALLWSWVNSRGRQPGLPHPCEGHDTPRRSAFAQRPRGDKWLAEVVALGLRVKLAGHLADRGCGGESARSAEDEAIRVFASKPQGSAAVSPCRARVTLGLDSGMRTGELRWWSWDCTGKA